MVMITLGTGIGVGIIIDGRMFRGRPSPARQATSRWSRTATQCSCGRRGCWETWCRGPPSTAAPWNSPSADPGGARCRLQRVRHRLGVHLAEAAAAGDRRRPGTRGGGPLAGEGSGEPGTDARPAPGRRGWGGSLGRTALVLGRAGSSTSGDVRLRLRPEVPAVEPARFGSWSGAVGAALAGRQVHNGDMTGDPLRPDEVIEPGGRTNSGSWPLTRPAPSPTWRSSSGDCCVIPGCPAAPNWSSGAAIAYAASPVDVIPDFVPVVGAGRRSPRAGLRRAPHRRDGGRRRRAGALGRLPGSPRTRPFDPRRGVRLRSRSAAAHRESPLRGPEPRAVRLR
jgi:hypothetical protein